MNVSTRQTSHSTTLFAEYPDLLTPKDISRITGFTVQYVRTLCREGKLPAVNVGDRSWFIPKPRFIDFVMGGGDHEPL